MPRLHLVSLRVPLARHAREVTCVIRNKAEESRLSAHCQLLLLQADAAEHLHVSCLLIPAGTAVSRLTPTSHSALTQHPRRLAAPHLRLHLAHRQPRLQRLAGERICWLPSEARAALLRSGK